MDSRNVTWNWAEKIAALSLPVLLAVFVYFSYSNRTHQLDDSLIVLRYLSNALEGNGLVYNPGERVNGLTSAFFAYCTLLVAWVWHGNVQLASVVVSALGWIGTALTFGLLFRNHSGYGLPAAVWGVFFLVVSRFTYITYGMETSLFMALAGLCLLFFFREDYFGLGIVSALLILTRAEGIFLVAVLIPEHFLLRRKNPRRLHFLIPAVLLTGQLAFNLVYYGAAIPQSASAKISQGESGVWAGVSFVKIGLGLYNLVFGGWMLFWTLALLATLGLLATRSRSLNRIFLIFLALYAAFFVFFRIPGQVWYYGPYLVALFFYGGVGVAFLTEKVLLRWGVLRAAAVALLASLLAAYAARSIEILPSFLGNVIREDYRKMGLWLKDNTAENARIAAVEIGTIGFYSDRYIVDILGLVSPPNARFVAAGDFASWTKHYDPDFILVHDPMWSIEEGARRLEKRGDYKLDRRFEFEGVRLLCKVPETGG